MKIFSTSMLAAAIFASVSVSVSTSAAIKVSDTNTAQFNFGGVIEPMCKVNSTGSANASALVLDQTNASQDIGSLGVWCNTGRNATTKYSSSNNGFLVDGNNKIAYTLDVGNTASAVDLASDYTASNTQAGSDNQGSAQTHALKITPVSTGLDSAGNYSDTITVTVSYN